MQIGNIVQSKQHGNDGIVLALTKDGKTAKVYVYSHHVEVWRPLTGLIVTVDSLSPCLRCQASGVYSNPLTGKSGICFRCEGKGEQSNEDRRRNHYYDKREAMVNEALDAIEQGNEPQPLPTPVAPAPKLQIRRKATKKNHPDPERKQLDKPKRKPKRQQDPANPHVTDVDDGLIDCKGCNTVHRDDTMCPW